LSGKQDKSKQRKGIEMSEAEKIANRAFEVFNERPSQGAMSFWLAYAYGYMSGGKDYSAERCKELLIAVYDAEVIFKNLCEGVAA